LENVKVKAQYCEVLRL